MTRTARLPKLAHLTVSLAFAGLLVGCGGDDESSQTTPSASLLTSTPTATTLDSGAVELTKKDAERIALAEAGDDATVDGSEEGDVDGRPVYRFDITVDGEQREITVDRVHGEVVTNEAAG
jgi:uncharacterized membrane protein YkoI